MEKVYWISEGDELGEMNKELEEYGGHVMLISSVPAPKDQRYCAHAFIVVAYPRDTLPKD